MNIYFIRNKWAVLRTAYFQKLYMKNLLTAIGLLLCMNLGFGQTTCSGTITYSSVPIRTSITLASALEIGDGGTGQITVCIEDQHTNAKCGGTVPTLYVIYDNGSGNEAFVAIWDMQTTPTGTCYTFPVCGEPLYLKRTSCVANDGTNSTISWYYTNYQGGEYRNRCTNAVLTASPSIDCINATEICASSTFPGNTNGPGIQEIGCAAPSGNDGGCLLGGENNSAWYYFEAASNGTVTFDILPATNKDDYDFAVWGPNPSCTNLGPPIRCNFALNKGATGLNTTATWTSENGGCVNGPGCTNTGYSQQLTVTAGEVYYLLVDGYATAVDPNYQITIGGTASLACIALNLDFNTQNDTVIVELDAPEIKVPLYYFTIAGSQIEDISSFNGVYVVKYTDGTVDKKHK